MQVQKLLYRVCGGLDGKQETRAGYSAVVFEDREGRWGCDAKRPYLHCPVLHRPWRRLRSKKGSLPLRKKGRVVGRNHEDYIWTSMYTTTGRGYYLNVTMKSSGYGKPPSDVDLLKDEWNLYLPTSPILNGSSLVRCRLWKTLRLGVALSHIITLGRISKIGDRELVERNVSSLR